MKGVTEVSFGMKAKVEVLIVGIQEEYGQPSEPKSSQLLSWGEDQGINFTIAASDLNARRLIGREGYRFRAVMIDLQLQQKPSNDQAYDQTEKLLLWIVESCPWASVIVLGAERYFSPLFESLADSVTFSEVDVWKDFESVLELVSEALEISRPPPPFAAGKMKFLREAGPLLFSLCKTAEPWALEADAIVVPTYGRGKLGEMGIAWSTPALLSPSLSELAKENPIEGPKTPQVSTASNLLSNAETSRTVIFATCDVGSLPTVSTAVDGCLASIELASRQQGLETLVLPLLGTGGGGLNAKEVLNAIFDQLDLPFTPNIWLNK